MAVSFSSSLISFSQRYGSFIFPIAADLAVYAIFKRVTCTGNVKNASAVVGLGVCYFFGRQTSTMIGWTGVALYLAIKVIAHDYMYPIEPQKPQRSIKDVERQCLGLQAQFVYVSDRVLDFNNQTFNTQFGALIEELKPLTDPLRAKWEDPDVLKLTRAIMCDCQVVLFKLHSILEQRTVSLRLDSADRLQKMAELLKDPNFDVENAFDRAFQILNHVYRFVRCKGYMLSLKNLQNVPEDEQKSSPVWGAGITAQYAHLFITGEGTQRELNKIFNDTQERLADLLKLVYPNSPLTAKDKQPVPGDYQNPGNPFIINTERE